jgi:hypothetical protein
VVREQKGKVGFVLMPGRCGYLEVKLHLFLTSALYGNSQPYASVALSPRNDPPRYPQDESWVDSAG